MIFLCFILGIAACKTKRMMTPAVEKLNEASVISAINTPVSFTFFDGRARVKIDSPYEKTKGVMYTRIIKDSLIWIAVKKLGVEGGRLLITRDSAFLINRIERYYQKKSIEDFGNSYGIDLTFSQIQLACVGLHQAIDTSGFYHFGAAGNQYKFSFSSGEYLVDYKADPFTGLVMSATITDKFDRSLQSTYDNYAYVKQEIQIPYFREYKFGIAKNDTLTVEVDYTSIELNNPKTIRFEIPPHYERIN